MSDFTSCPYCKFSGPHLRIAEEKRGYLFCQECGAVFRDLDPALHKSMTETVYTTESWGKTRQDSINAHGPRLSFMLDWFHENSSLNERSRFLDIGAGVGVLEHVLFEKLKTSEIDLTAIEPVSQNVDFLQKDYPNIRVLRSDIENVTPDHHTKLFDIVFCFGVDYLFRNIDLAFGRIKQMLNAKGRVLISRNVFLEMPCFWGGRRIKTFNDLVGPNPLISLFLFKDQYKELVSRHFRIVSSIVGQEAYFYGSTPDTVKGQHLLLDCLRKAEQSHEEQPIKKAGRGLKRLQKLGVTFER